MSLHGGEGGAELMPTIRLKILLFFKLVDAALDSGKDDLEFAIREDSGGDNRGGSF
jgi:hypothetical protein